MGSCSERDMKNKKSGIRQEMKINGLTKEQLLDQMNSLQDKIIILQKTVATQRKTEDALIISEKNLSAILEKNADGIVIVNKNGRVLYVNPAAEKLFDRTKEEFLGYPFGFPVSDNKITEYHIIKKNGVLCEAEFHVVNIQWEKHPAYQLSVRDITGRKNAELELLGAKDKAEESDRLKTAFLHNISHEIRTPLNAIVGFSALLGEPGETEETRKSFIEIIRGSSDYLLDIVSGIIEISNIEAGILKLNLNEINLNGILKNLHEQFKAKTDEKGIGLSYETLLSENNAYIQADNNKMIQILSNLLNNAIKFTNTGQIEFGYKVINNYLEFYVSDTGIGIQHDQSERIFDRFYQVDNSVSRLYEGTGLGLSISKSYVEFLGGKIWLRSRPGSGTIFYFTIPYLKTVKPFITDWKVMGTEKIILKEQKTVLIAEDEESNCLLMKEQLSSLHVDILYAINGKEAVDMCAADKKIDLVLMDIKMPVMNGFEATEKIRNFLPDLPIIATTAYAFETDREKALSIGCSDYISKPIGKDAFLEVVNKYLY